ncbi:lysozyme inhibitor LprI family protein [Ancylobacter sp. Lp-2]|uniref:lysozyme inhibitor LprI family protein n=1 Tax=Ancylobacter sp. Lp-2 TaxID=2881339 RepID=UPI001E2FBE14|nr:lysozyme inhibitor LprI family protein [Ancylobacter sp. Lp-2]MCB4769223.1 lysozyme inhibitor LprI family protein [Ancylobacter sp. Lp-2]
MRPSSVCRATLLGFAAFASSPAAHADQACYDRAQSQAALTACSVDDLKLVDDQLNKRYKDMQARLKGDDTTRKLLVDAQKKWVAFRDAECALSTVRTAGGSINPMNFNICATDLTQKRVTDLQAYLACGQQSGDQTDEDCAIPAAP